MYQLVWLILTLLNIIDYLCTMVILRHGGAEQNPIQQYMIHEFGNIGMLYVKLPLLLVLWIGLVFVKEKSNVLMYVLLIVTVLYAMLDLYSMTLINKIL